MSTSQNGYRANDTGLITRYRIPGTVREVSLRKGAAGELLIEWAAWFDKHVEDIEGGVYDDWGFAVRPIRGSTTTLSNHASGTAIDLNATRHPLGKGGTFTAKQAAAIRAELKRYEGAIRWGGDYHNRLDAMHFEVVVSEAACARVLAKIRRENDEGQMNNVQKLRRDVNAAVSKYGNQIPAKRVAARAMVASIRAALKIGPTK